MAGEAIAGVVRPGEVPTTPHWRAPRCPSFTKEGIVSQINRVK